METPVRPADEILAEVVRGQVPLSSLQQIGIHATFGYGSYTEHMVKHIHITVEASDLALGLLRLQTSPAELRRWALFVMGTDAVDLERVQDHPYGDKLIQGLWNASFGHGID